LLRPREIYIIRTHTNNMIRIEAAVCLCHELDTEGITKCLEEGLLTSEDILNAIRTYLSGSATIVHIINRISINFFRMSAFVKDLMNTDDILLFLRHTSKKRNLTSGEKIICKELYDRVDRYSLEADVSYTDIMIIFGSKNEVTDYLGCLTVSEFMHNRIALLHRKDIRAEIAEYLEFYRIELAAYSFRDLDDMFKIAELAEFSFRDLEHMLTYSHEDYTLDILIVSIIIINHEEELVRIMRKEPRMHRRTMMRAYEEIKGEPFVLDDVDSLRWVISFPPRGVHQTCQMLHLSEKIRRNLETAIRCPLVHDAPISALQAYVDQLY